MVGWGYSWLLWLPDVCLYDVANLCFFAEGLLSVVCIFFSSLGANERGAAVLQCCSATVVLQCYSSDRSWTLSPSESSRFCSLLGHLGS